MEKIQPDVWQNKGQVTVIKLNGLVNDDITKKVASRLAIAANKENEALALPEPGQFTEVSAITVDASEVLNYLGLAITQFIPNVKAMELRFQKQELRLKNIENRVTRIEGQCDAMKIMASEAYEKIEVFSESLANLIEKATDAKELQHILDGAIATFGASMVATFKDALTAGEEARAISLQLQAELRTLRKNGDEPSVDA